MTTKSQTIIDFVEPEDYDECKTVSEVVSAAACRMDNAEAWQITGCPVFKCSDGKWYVGTLRFDVEPVNPEYLVDILSDDRCECPHCGHIDRHDDMADIGPEDTSGDGLCTECTHISFRITKERAMEIAGIKKPARRRRGGLK